MRGSIQQYVNINAMCSPALLNRITGASITLDELLATLPPSIAEIELSRDLLINIPMPVLDLYSTFRPTPLERARAFELAIGTKCRIFYKDEGRTPCGTHKGNSAYLIAALCARDGVYTIATETTGNWGFALALAAKAFSIRCVCFIDDVSYRNRADRMRALAAAGAEVRVIPCEGITADYLTRTANEAIQYTRDSSTTAYLFGSIFNYFTIPQSVIGLEAEAQLQAIGEYPNVVFGVCGGGANFLGITAPFLLERLQGRSAVEFVAAEAESAPIVTRGECGIFTVDELGYYPPLRTQALPTMVEDGVYIGGLGSRVLSSAVSQLVVRGVVTAATIRHEEATQASRLFHETERRWIALESSYTLAAVIREAKRRENACLLLNLSSGETDRHLVDVSAGCGDLSRTTC